MLCEEAEEGEEERKCEVEVMMTALRPRAEVQVLKYSSQLISSWHAAPVKRVRHTQPPRTFLPAPLQLPAVLRRCSDSDSGGDDDGVEAATKASIAAVCMLTDAIG
eukprot:COSAG06_NODE_32015_length_512_cov_1.716707_1_plen_105_part_10